MNPLFLGLALVVAAPTLKDPAKGPSLLGRWEEIENIQEGTTFNLTGSTTEFVAGGKRLYCSGPGAEVEERGYKLIPKTTPAAIDLIRPNGTEKPDEFPCILKIEGDKLTIAVGPSGGARPKSFEPNDPGVYMRLTFRRAKKD